MPSLTIRTGEDIKGAMRIKDACNCKSVGEAVHVALQLFALMSDELLLQLHAFASADARTLDQEIIVLLQEAVAARKSHQEWLDYAKSGEI